MHVLKTKQNKKKEQKEVFLVLVFMVVVVNLHATHVLECQLRAGGLKTKADPYLKSAKITHTHAQRSN